MGKGVTLTSRVGLAVLCLGPLQGRFAVGPAWTHAEPSEGVGDLQLFTKAAAGTQRLGSFSLSPALHKPGLGRVRALSVTKRIWKLVDGQQLTVPWLPFGQLLLCGGLGSVLPLGWFRLLLII